MLFDLFFTFFKLGLFTFGGGYAMIPHIKDTVIEKKHWIEEDELLEIIAIAESTPGPIAINMATYIGYKKAKLLGSLMATLGVVLPSVIIIILISLIYDKFMENEIVKFAFVGIKCAVAILITKAGINMAIKAEKKVLNIVLFSIVFVLLIVFEILQIHFSSIYLILIGGLISILINYKKKEEEQ